MRARGLYRYTRFRQGHVGNTVVPPDTPWEDVGEGECPLCKDVRRLYQAIEAPAVTACAVCSQKYALSSIPNHERPASDDQAE